MKKLLILIIASAALTGVNAQAKTRVLTLKERAIVQQAVKADMLDPDSAKIEILPYVEGSKWACGRVNGKNRFGGYVGYLPFGVMVTNTPARVIKTAEKSAQYSDWADEQTLAILAVAHCREAGYALDDPRGKAYN